MLRRYDRRSLGSRIGGVVPFVAVAAVIVVAIFASLNVLGSIPYNPSHTSRGSASDVASSPGLDDETGPASFDASPTPVPTPKLTASLPAEAPLVLAMVVSQSQKGVWTASLKYPRFRPETTPWADVMNADLRDEAEDRVWRYSIGTAAVKTPGKINTLTGGFDIELLTPTLASFTLFWTDSTFKTEENPAIEQIETVSFDLGTGQRMSLSELFSNQTSALSILSTRSRDLLRDKLGGDYDEATVVEGTKIEFDDGTGTGDTVRDGRSFSNWVLTRDGLRLTWLAGVVAPTEVGEISVLIPWTELAAVLDPIGPAAALAR